MREDDDAQIAHAYSRLKPWGMSASIDLQECNPETIRNPEKLQEFVVSLCDLIEVRRFGEPSIVHFGRKSCVEGYSLTQLIETSLLSGHFANESNSAYIDIFSCRSFPPYKAAEFCRDFFDLSSFHKGRKRTPYFLLIAKHPVENI